VQSLAERISTAGLSAAVACTFAEALRELAGADGVVSGEEHALVDRLMGEDTRVQGVVPADFSALWPHAELFLTACVYVAVIDGSYGIEETRRVSEYAHRLGFSAHRLAELEARVFRELKARSDKVLQLEASGLAPITSAGEQLDDTLVATVAPAPVRRSQSPFGPPSDPFDLPSPRLLSTVTNIPDDGPEDTEHTLPSISPLPDVGSTELTELTELTERTGP